jgi:hypothetical protein
MNSIYFLKRLIDLERIGWTRDVVRGSACYPRDIFEERGTQQNASFQFGLRQSKTILRSAEIQERCESEVATLIVSRSA